MTTTISTLKRGNKFKFRRSNSVYKFSQIFYSEFETRFIYTDRYGSVYFVTDPNYPIIFITSY